MPWEGQKTTSDPLELEVVVNHLTRVLGPKFRFPGRAVCSLNAWAVFISSPSLNSSDICISDSHTAFEALYFFLLFLVRFHLV